MANLTEAAVWEAGIYQFEEEDLVQGGADGIDNVQPKQLANRTLYLKGLVEGLALDKQDAAVLLTAIASLVGAADKLAYFTGANSAAMTAFTAFARTLLAAADQAAARAVLGAASPADIATAVAALVNSSPAALDTLNEFAAALGNDANFATTTTNALAAKAPLASPSLTGNPTAPTPPQFDNDTSLATTEFVKRALGNHSGAKGIGSSQALTAADAGKLIQFSTGGTYTVTLPDTGTVADGTAFTFVSTGSSAGTVQRAGGDVISTNGAFISSFSVGVGDFAIVVKYATSWLLLGSVSLPDSPLFAKSLSGTGYQKLPGGLIIQWGSLAATASSAAATFPVAFTTACYSVVTGSLVNSNGASDTVEIGSLSVTGFAAYGVVNGVDGTVNCYFIAIGK